MIAELGHFALALALILAFAQTVLPLLGAELRDTRMMAAAAPLALGQCFAIAAAFGCLMYSYAINDTTVLNVVQNSHSAKPMLYKVAGAWGNHEGSMLLWVTVLGVAGAACAVLEHRLPGYLPQILTEDPMAGQLAALAGVGGRKDASEFMLEVALDAQGRVSGPDAVKIEFLP